MGRNQNMCGKSNIKRKTSPKRTSQLFRLLYRETRFEIKTNRRIRNRTYGGVRGREIYLKFPSYSILGEKGNYGLLWNLSNSCGIRFKVAAKKDPIPIATVETDILTAVSPKRKPNRR